MKIDSPLPRSNPRELKISASAILELLDEAERTDVELNSLMIVRHGKVAAEGYFYPYSAEIERSVHSVTKSLAATAIGLLMEEGLLTTESKVISFFPGELPADVSEYLSEMSIRHLLTMTCGHDSVPPRKGTDNYVKKFLEQPVVHKPGTYFLYNSMGSYMLTAIIRKVSGQNMMRYLRPRIFEPLGIYDVYCDTCPMGIEFGGGGAFLRTEDMAKLAQLYLQRGIWEGHRLLPEWWIQEFTKLQFRESRSRSNPTQKPDWFCGYGYQNWRCTQKNAYRFDGSFGQLAVVLEDYDAVLVTTASEARAERILALFWKYLIPAFDKESSEEDCRRLEKRLSGLRIKWPEPTPVSPRSSDISMKRIIPEQNLESMVTTKRQSLAFSDAYTEFHRIGIQEFVLNFEEPDICYLSYIEDERSCCLPIGLTGKMEKGLLKSVWHDYPVVSTGRWLNEFEFEVRILTITADYCTIVSFDFSQEVVKIVFSETPYDPVKRIPEPRCYSAYVQS